MNIPGSNILSMALTVIAPQPVNWFKFIGHDIGPTGLSTATYNDPQTVKIGSLQIVSRDRYEDYGLDWQKNYVTWFVPNIKAVPVQRNPDGDGDVIEWPVNADGSLIAGASRRWQLISDTPWSYIDGWTYILAIDIGPATGATTNA